jgi:hypothetical protein
MNLFRKHKKFEDQLKEQLGDTEYKPSESLWDRIDSDITKDGFETEMQNSLENFEQVPYSDTWDKIAAELPEVKTGNHLFKYYGFSALILLFAVGVWVGYEWNNQENTLMDSTETPTSAQTSPANEKNNPVVALSAKSEGTTANTIAPLPSSPAVVSKTPVMDQANESKQSSSPALNRVETESSSTNTVTLQSIGRSSKQNPQTTKQAKLIAVEKDREEVVIPLSAQQPSVSAVSVAIPVPVKEQVVAKTETEQTNEAAPPVIPPVVAKVVVSTPPANATAVANEDARVVGSSPSIQPDTTFAIARPDVARPKQEELTNVSISIMAGAHMCYMSYSSPGDPQFNFEQNIALRKSLERPDIDWSGAFFIDYRISKKWMLSTGMLMVNFNQQFDYNTVTASTPLNKNEIPGPVYTTDSVITGNVYSNRIKYSWTEIPLLVNYNIRRGQRWDIDMQAGVGYAFLNTVDAGMVANDNKGVFALKDKDAFPQIKNAVFVSVMPQVSYRFGENVSVGFVPTFKYSATSIIGNERWVQQNPYFVGMNVCMRKRF